jgi:hypothetical protein
MPINFFLRPADDTVLKAVGGTFFRGDRRETILLK